MKQTNRFFLILGALVLLLAVAGGSYYLGIIQQTATLSDRESNTISPSIATNATTPALPSSLPNWSYKSSASCKVQFLLPPKTVDSDGRFWNFPRGSISTKMISTLADPTQKRQANAIYASQKDASGNIFSAVSVSCLPNDSSLTNPSIIIALNEGIDKYNLQNNSEGLGPTKYTIKSSKTLTRWNQQVIDLTVDEYYQNSGGQPFINTMQYTVFTTPELIYEVSTMGSTTSTSIKDTAKKIFENLKFDK